MFTVAIGPSDWEQLNLRGLKRLGTFLPEDGNRDGFWNILLFFKRSDDTPSPQEEEYVS